MVFTTRTVVAVVVQGAAAFVLVVRMKWQSEQLQCNMDLIKRFRIQRLGWGLD